MIFWSPPSYAETSISDKLQSQIPLVANRLCYRGVIRRLL